jgi:hypothetical protein
VEDTSLLAGLLGTLQYATVATRHSGTVQLHPPASPRPASPRRAALNSSGAALPAACRWLPSFPLTAHWGPFSLPLD